MQFNILKKTVSNTMKAIVTLYLVAVVAVLMGSFFSLVASGEQDAVIPAPDFTATDEDGIEFSLSEYTGNVIILHFTSLETPLCLECEKEMKEQLRELESLYHSGANVSIVTVNIRKNPDSERGKELAEQSYGVNVTWHWVEDFNPFPVASLYADYWTYKDALANPTIVLIDGNQSIVGVYHIYCIGKGVIDGIQSAESLTGDIEKIMSGEWSEFKGEVSTKGVTFIGMFLLGIITAISPCSIALLISMISYVGAMRTGKANAKKESLQGFKVGIIFTLGMSLVFFVIGMLISYVGIFIEASTIFYLATGIILLILGINIIKPLRELFFPLFKSSDKDGGIMEKGGAMFKKLSERSLVLGAFFLGILFAVGWAPCAISLVFPVFILVLTQETSLLMGGLLLFVFGIGHGVPIIPLTTFTSGMRAKLGNAYVSAGKVVQKIFAGVIILLAVIFMLRYFGIRFW